MSTGRFYYIFFSGFSVIIMCLSKLTEYYLDLDFKTYGIFPREMEGLKGIVLTPFIHDNFNHLLSNIFPFFFLSTAIFYFYRGAAFRIVLYCWFFTNVAVWLGGRSAWHIGASGLVYSFASFLFFSGILSKDRRLVAISLLVIFLYGGMIWGIFPNETNISWESHLFGFLAGFAVAFYSGKSIIRQKVFGPDENEMEFKHQDSTADVNTTISYMYKDEDG